MEIYFYIGAGVVIMIFVLVIWIKQQKIVLSGRTGTPVKNSEIISISHDLVNPVTAILLNSAYLAKRLKKAKLVEWEQYANNCFLAAKKLELYVTFMKGNCPKRAIVFSVNQEIRDLVAIFSTQIKMKKISLILQMEANIFLTGSPLIFCRVLANLLTNAVEACGNKSQRQIILNCRQQNSQLFIRVSDIGRGITLKQQKNIFHVGYSLKKNHSGLGLSIARRLLREEFRGKLRLVPEINKTSFEICIPLKQ
jgi:signal transduction histidine kinase